MPQGGFIHGPKRWRGRAAQRPTVLGRRTFEPFQDVWTAGITNDSAHIRRARSQRRHAAIFETRFVALRRHQSPRGSGAETVPKQLRPRPVPESRVEARKLPLRRQFSRIGLHVGRHARHPHRHAFPNLHRDEADLHEIDRARPDVGFRFGDAESLEGRPDRDEAPRVGRRDPGHNRVRLVRPTADREVEPGLESRPLHEDSDDVQHGLGEGLRIFLAGGDERAGIGLVPVLEQRFEDRLTVLEEPVETGAREAEPRPEGLYLHRTDAAVEQRLLCRPEPQLARAAPASRPRCRHGVVGLFHERDPIPGRRCPARKMDGIERILDTNEH